jgi:hypothetical protein
MAIAALYFSLLDRMAGLFDYLGLGCSMASITDVRLAHSGALHMNGMAVRTGNIIGQMLANDPERQI